jgi:2-dehydro-3-deoxyphosphooctonate aldolase (KDO 8-P synthase)
MDKVPIKNFLIGHHEPLVVMSGPCVIESEKHCLESAEILKKMFDKHGVRLVFKSSYDKANRSSYSSFRGPGLKEGLRILNRVREEFDLPVVTDVHSPEEAIEVGQVCEVIQIPAFLCRQTDLIVAAAQTGVVISVKKGQFLAPWDMSNVVNKITATGNKKIILVDRGTTFGYNNLVSDMRSIPIMQRLGYPICYDATHSVQKPGGLGHMSGGDRDFITPLTMAALGAGANCLFMESHPNPSEAKSDADSVLSFRELDSLLPKLKQLYELMQKLNGPIMAS